MLKLNQGKIHTAGIWDVELFKFLQDRAVINKLLFFAVVIAALLTQPALAEPGDDVMEGLQRCRTIQDDRAWLDCSYRAHQPMRAKLGLPPAPEFQQRLVPPAAPLPSAGTTLRKLPSSAPPHRKASVFEILIGGAPPVTISTLGSVRHDSEGAFVVTLQNGQVWRQVDAEFGITARLKVGARMTVKPGALGSYNLETDDNPLVYKVELKT
jgi:hypothetical protein